MEIMDIKTERKNIEKKLQNEYSKKSSYEEKLIFIYNILMQSQDKYLNYNNVNLFSEAYLSKLIKDIKNQVMDEEKFVYFIQEKLIKKINSGHVFLKILEPDKLIKNKNVSDDTTNNIPLFNYKNNNVEVVFINSNTVVIKIKSFADEKVQSDKYIYDNLNNYLEQNKNVDNIIIDIRGNEGGSDRYFQHFNIFTSVNDENIYNERYHDLFSDNNINYNLEIIPKGKSNRVYNKYLLVDGEVFSTSEKFTKFCKQTGYATVIGEKTKGEGFGLTPLQLVISEDFCDTRSADSKTIGLVFPTEAPVNEIGKIDYENCYNTIPDILCPSNQALDITLEQIDEKTRNFNK